MPSLNNLTFISSFFAKLPQQKIAQVISVFLLIYITFIAAKTTWIVIPNDSDFSNFSNVSNVKRTQSQTQSKSLDLSKLQSLNLFGAYNESVVDTTVETVVKNAPETRLKLKLSGLVASDKPETAAAIIEYKKQQETYGVGDVIKGTRASLEQVLIDRVIIKQSGRLETLMLDGADYGQPAQGISNKKENNKDNKNKTPQQTKLDKSSSKATIVDQRTNTDLSRSAQLLRADLNNNPGKITDYLRISPSTKSGKIVGYRLSPGKKPEFFKLSGLKSGDIAVQMNGYNLLAPLEAAQAMSALKTEQNISLLVERNSELIEILFSIQ
jgi:general secretion pathway protein C